jgi:hypothetical protein
MNQIAEAIKLTNDPQNDPIYQGARDWNVEILYEELPSLRFMLRGGYIPEAPSFDLIAQLRRQVEQYGVPVHPDCSVRVGVGGYFRLDNGSEILIDTD